MTAENLKFKITNQKGAAAVEFAIVLPLLLIFIFGVIEFGLLLFNQQVLTNAVREGARTGVVMRHAPRTVATEDTLIKDAVLLFSQNHMITFGSGTFDGNNVLINKDESTGIEVLRQFPDDFDFGDPLKVEAEFDYAFLFLSINIGPFNGIGPIKLSSESTMKME